MKNKIQYILSTLVLSLVLAFNAQAQSTSQKIGNNLTNISPNAVLEMESATKGVLFPRVTLKSITDVITVPSPTNGLTVFNTATAGTSPDNVSLGYYYWSATASKWVKLAVETPPIEFAKTVYVNSMSPSTATIFDETNPAATNISTLAAAVANLYIGNDGSTWTYDPTGAGTYKTYSQPSSTPFNLANSTTDAGNNKTGSIWRTGNIGIGINSPATNLHIQNALPATANANANARVLRLSRPTLSGLKWDNIAQFNLGSYSTAIAAQSRLDLALTDGGNAVDFTNVMTWQANGNVGIGNTAPNAPLVVQGRTKDTGVLKLVGPLSPQANDTWWMGFGHGTPSGDDNDRARIGVDVIGGGDGRLFFTTGKGNAQTRAMFIDEGQRVGIGTSTPTAQLEIATTNGLSTVIRRNTSAAYQPANLILQKTASASPNTNTAVSTGEYVGAILFSAANGTFYPTNGTAIVGYAAGVQSASNNGGGIFFRTVPEGNTNAIERMRIENNGNVGIGNYNNGVYTAATAPGSKLEVDGSSTNKTAYNAGTGTIIDFSKSNLAYTDASPGTFTINNIKDGGTYTLAVRGTTIGTSVFTFPGSLIQKGPGIGAPTVSGKETLYTFLVIGDRVYVYMTAGI